MIFRQEKALRSHRRPAGSGQRLVRACLAVDCALLGLPYDGISNNAMQVKIEVGCQHLSGSSHLLDDWIIHGDDCRSASGVRREIERLVEHDVVSVETGFEGYGWYGQRLVRCFAFGKRWQAA